MILVGTPAGPGHTSTTGRGGRLTLPGCARTLARPGTCSLLPDPLVEPTVLSRAPDAHSAPGDRRTITQLIAAGALDAELAALLWLLVERRVPLLVTADPPGVGETELLQALLHFLPADVDVRSLRGIDEDFAWLPQARELGWSGPLPVAAAAADPARSVLHVRQLDDQGPGSMTGTQARVVVRSLQLGYGLATTLRADSLEDVFSRLEAEPVALSPDEIRRLGVVLVLRASGGRLRVVAAHYLRPLERDGHGHLQRRPPAILATWDPARDRFEHFAWGVSSELALRAGYDAPDLDGRHATRAAFLHRLVHAGTLDQAAVRRALRAHHDHPTHDDSQGDP